MKRPPAPQMPGTRRKTTKPRTKKRTPTVPPPSAEARERMVGWFDTKFLRYLPAPEAIGVFDKLGASVEQHDAIHGLACLAGGLDCKTENVAEECFGRALEPEELVLLAAFVWQLKKYESKQRMKAPETIEPRHVDWAEARIWAVDMHVRAALSGATAEQRAALLRALSESAKLQAYLRDNATKDGQGNKTRRATDTDMLPVIAGQMERLFNIDAKVANRLVCAALRLGDRAVSARRAKPRT